MSDIDWSGFAAEVEARLDARDLSYGRAVERWPELNRAMLSRAVNGRRLSVENYLLICVLLRIPVTRYWRRHAVKRVRGPTVRSIVKRLRKQPVTARVCRETAEIAT